jgi:lipoprotein-releasing system permease protein
MYARSIKSKLYPIFQWLELQKVNEYVILILMLIICVINMATGILILIFERTHLVGVLSAIGYPFRVIRNIFLYYAGYILSRGLLWGNAVALILLAIQYFFQPITLDEESYYLAYAPVEFDWLKILAVNAGTAVLILLCMLIPTLLVKRLNPVKALRFK